MALGVFLSSYAPNLATFMFCYSFLFGTGIGLAYTAPMVNGWRWFPDRKGMVSGAVVAGFGAGGFVFNQVSTVLDETSRMEASFFVPSCLRLGALLWLRGLLCVLPRLTAGRYCKVRRVVHTSTCSFSGQVAFHRLG